MPFPFGKSHKSPADIVKNLKDSMTVLEKHDISDKKAEKVGDRADLRQLLSVSGRTEGACVIQATEEVSKSLVAMKEILYGTNEKEPQTEAVAQLAQELYNSGLLGTLVADLQLIDFEVSSSPRSVLFQTKGDACGDYVLYLSLPGKERRGPDLQQHPQAPDWHSDAHGGVPVHPAEHPLHATQRVKPQIRKYDFHCVFKEHIRGSRNI